MAVTNVNDDAKGPVRYDDKEAARIINRMGNLAGERESWETEWQDISDYVLPRKSSINTVEPQGEQRTVRIHDTTAIRANEKFAAGIYGYLTPPDRQWFSLEAEDPNLQEVPAVRDWFSDTSEKMHRKLLNTNWQEEIHETYLQLGAFCTAALFLDEDYTFKDIPCGRYYIAEDESGFVDTVYRRFPYTARQAVQYFGEKELPSDIVNAAREADKPDVDKEYIFIHAIEPRSDYDLKKNDSLNMPIKSTWVSEDFNKVVKEGGFNEKPIFVTRYLKSNVEVYGRGPGTAHLPDAKQLNFMEKTVIKQVEKLVDPPILIPDDGATTYKFRTAPNSINYWKATNPANRPEPFQLNNIGALSFGEEKLEQKRQTIREAWHNDFFQAITTMDKQMTATEVLERVEERIVLFAPTMGRLQSELYTPMLERLFSLMYREGGYFNELPAELAADPRFKISYTGKISQAMKMVQNKAILQTMEYILPTAEVKPEILDIYNFDEIYRDIGLNNGMRVKYFNDEKTVDMMRQQRAQQEQAMQQAQMNQMESQSLNNVAQAQATVA